MISTLHSLVAFARSRGKQPVSITVPHDWYVRLDLEFRAMMVKKEVGGDTPTSFTYQGIQIHKGYKVLMMEFDQ